MSAELGRPTPRPAFADTRGVPGALVLSGFILIVVAGIVAIIWALQLMGPNQLVVEVMAGLILGVLTVIGAVLVWYGRQELGGIFSIVAGVVFLVIGPDTAGLFAVLGGILVLVANRAGELVA